MASPPSPALRPFECLRQQRRAAKSEAFDPIRMVTWQQRGLLE
jgi:hypothetical protein